MKRILYIPITFALVLVMAILVWTIAVPEEAIVETFNAAARQGGVELRLEGFKKGIFFNIYAEGASFIYQNNPAPILAVEDLRVSFNILSFITLNPSVDFQARIKEGTLKGSFNLKGKRVVNISAQTIQLSNLTGLSLVGIAGAGILKLSYQEDSGEFKVNIQEAHLKPFVSGAVTIPLDMFQALRGSGSIKDGALHLTSVALEGKGIHAVLRGVIGSGRANMSIEIMAHNDFAQLPLLDVLLGRFKKSPGFYVAPVTLPFAHPLGYFGQQ